MTDFSPAVIIERKNFDALFDALKQMGYHIIGPTLQSGAIVYDTMINLRDLPVGWREAQEKGTYRLVKRNDLSIFGFNSTPQSWKRFLHPPTQLLWQSKKRATNVTIAENVWKAEKLAFLGVRACDLKAIEILKKVLIDSPYTDTNFKKRSANVFIVAVNCSQAGGTCFCASMKSGPKVQQGYDLALTEVVEKDRHYFAVEIGTKRGAEIVKIIPHRDAKIEEMENAEHIIENTITQMGREVDITNLKQLLYNNSEHKRWNDTAKRCLTCANCTMVCPTCFCTMIEDVTDLTGQQAERKRKWDSCFTLDFSYIHGGSIRPSVYSRYRQWLTHKFASWQDQFGTSGCVGCGRCITWCPVGIDVTEEITAIRAIDNTQPSNIITKEKK